MVASPKMVPSRTIARRLPIGAEVQPEGGVHFRVWAPRRKTVHVVFEGDEGPRTDVGVELEPEGEGYFSGWAEDAAAGTRYRYRLDGGEAFPDPASRFQPDGPHGPTEVIDPAAFTWTDAGWPGARLAGQVIYEMHVGTFTRAGTWEAAARQLRELATLGITCVELMPIADFAGHFGWGYDGVDLYAPTRLYGTPDDFRRFVDRAHEVGIAVILDVVYNHLGPDGAYLSQFSADYFTDRHENDWGEPLNFDGAQSEAVREYFIENAGYWIDEFHLDGLRLDATQQIYDASPVNVMREVARRARQAAGARPIVIVAENEPQDVKLIKPPEEGGYGIDALWNDDFHHTAVVALTGRHEAYYTDYIGTPQEFISAAKWGYLYQGQRYAWQKAPRGTPALDRPPAAFVNFIQNHDQVANSARGLRVHEITSPGRFRAMTALLLLGPGTPMLFQGQEFASSAPFHYFADHKPELAEAVRKGRAGFMKQFRSIASREAQQRLPDPGDPATFERCKLDFAEREHHAEEYALHRDLLRLRREHAAFRAQRPRAVDGAVLGAEAFLLRFFAEGGDDRLLLVNLGRDLDLYCAPEPLIAPVAGRPWKILWSSEDPRYGGGGTAPIETEQKFWRLPGHAAVVLSPEEAS